jgi:hypothetical protein
VLFNPALDFLMQKNKNLNNVIEKLALAKNKKGGNAPF